MYSSVSQWLYYLAGLQLQDAAFENVLLAPQAVLGLSSASVSIQSPRGPLSLTWVKTGGMQCEKV